MTVIPVGASRLSHPLLSCLTLTIQGAAAPATYHVAVYRGKGELRTEREMTGCDLGFQAFIRVAWRTRLPQKPHSLVGAPSSGRFDRDDKV